LYLDSAILVQLVVREPDSEFFADFVEGQYGAQSSELAMVECRSALTRKREYGQIDARTHSEAWNFLQAYWSRAGGLTLHPVSQPVLLEAGEVIERCAGRAPLRTLDAIHLATCLRTHAFPLVTNDTVLRAAAESLNVPVSPLPA
jgi:predicted nucleic acid-binding protein